MLKEAKVDADMVLVATQNWQTLVRAFPNFSQFSRVVTRINFKDGAVFADPPIRPLRSANCRGLTEVFWAWP